MFGVVVLVDIRSSPLKSACSNSLDVDGGRVDGVLANFVTIINVVVVVAGNVEDEARRVFVGILESGKNHYIFRCLREFGSIQINIDSESSLDETVGAGAFKS